MAIKKKSGGGGGGANWMDTYGDMVTLLLCFFVLLYSMSTISEEKFRAIVQSFNPGAIQIVTDPGGKGGSFADPEQGDDYPGVLDPSELDLAQIEIDDMMNALYEAISEMVSSEGMASTIQVTMDDGKVYVRFSDTVFFLGDSSVLQPGAKLILGKLCPILDAAAPAIDEIRVQGHTAQAYADRRNDPRKDRELSSARAMEVVLFIQENSSIHPARLINEGFGQWRPISSNATGETRAANRRVEMIISGVDLEAEELNEALAQFISIDDDDGGRQSVNGAN